MFRKQMKSRLGLIGAVVIAAAVAVSAQGRGGGAWTTVGGDAQRTSFVRADPKISLAAMQSPGFQFLWKRKLDNDRLTQPLLLPNIIAYKGFKALAFVGSASGQVYSIDYDLNRMFWQQKLATSAPKAAACSSGVGMRPAFSTCVQPSYSNPAETCVLGIPEAVMLLAASTRARPAAK